MGKCIVHVTHNVFKKTIVKGWMTAACGEDLVKSIDGFPVDAKLEGVDTGSSVIDNGVMLLFSHPSWPEVEHCSQWPIVKIVG